VALTYASAAQVRAEIAVALQGRPGYADIGRIAFGRPVAVRAPLRMSNPSERLKWDTLFKAHEGTR